MVAQLYTVQTPQGIDYVIGGLLSSSVVPAGGFNPSAVPGYIGPSAATVGSTVFDIERVVEKAWRRCKLEPGPELTPEWIDTIRSGLFLALADMANEGIALWKVNRVLLPCQPGLASIPCPVGSMDMLNANWRLVTQWQGGVTSSDGQTASMLVDGSVSGHLTQNVANGNISIDLGSTSLHPITTFGVMSYGNQYYQLAIEASSDNATWNSIATLPQLLFPDNQFVWFDIDGSPPYEFWRIRETGGNTLSLREVVFGFNPQSVPLGRENRDTFSQLPNRTFQSAQPSIFWFDKQRDQPLMQLYAVPNGYFIHIEAWIHFQLQDLGTQTQYIDAPQRWYDAICWKAAAALAVEHPKVPPAWEQRVSQKCDIAVAKAWSHESDRGPVRIQVDLSAYTS